MSLRSEFNLVFMIDLFKIRIIHQY